MIPPMVDTRLITATPLFVFDDDMTVVEWNEGAAELTGLQAEDVVGEPCWSVLAACDDNGSFVCHRDCSHFRHARAGHPLPRQALHVRTANGTRRRVEIDTLTARDGDRSLYLHLMHDAPLAEDAEEQVDLGPPPELTARQREILGLIGEGLPARAVAAKLSLTESTVRNHIRAILVELGAHSQLQAVFKARLHGVL